MAGVTILLTVTLLTITLTNNCVQSSVSGSVPYDNVRLSASNSLINPKIAEGISYPKGEVEKLPDACCLAFKKKDEPCEGSVPALRHDCSCNIVYQDISCTRGAIPFYTAVKKAGGNGVVFTTWSGYRLEEPQQFLNLTDNHDSIPVILLESDDAGEIWSLDEYGNITLRIEIIDPSLDNPPSNGLQNTRSATTFYFVVFAFTILLLLSLTWFVFNYLRRCHHMYTLKRQRAELLSKTRRAIEKCPTKTYKKAKKTGQRTVSKDDTDSVTSDEEERCPICLETFKMKDVLRVLPCHHEFHKSCIDPWLYEKGTCPMCKLNIVGDQEECDSEQVSRELRILTIPVGLELEMLEEGLSAAESDHNNVNQQSNANENLQVESVE